MKCPVPLFLTTNDLPASRGKGRSRSHCCAGGVGKRGREVRAARSRWEHYASDLQSYYRALTVHPHHNYYFGRSEADLTPRLEYFISTLAEVFEAVRLKAQKCAENGTPAEPEALRRLDHRARVVLGLFARRETITAPEVAGELGLSGRMARNLLKDWVEDGWLQVTNPSRRARATVYRQNIGNTSASYRQCLRKERTTLIDYSEDAYDRATNHHTFLCLGWQTLNCFMSDWPQAASKAGRTRLKWSLSLSSTTH